jgi:hypothetical protein
MPFSGISQTEALYHCIVADLITAQLMEWDSLRTIEKAIRSDDIY